MEPSAAKDIIKIKCIICSKTEHAGVREKFRMIECPRAQRFLQAVLYFQDDVYTKVADLEDETSVFGADLYYPKTCLESYFQRYSRAKTSSSKANRKGPKKRNLLLAEVDVITNLLNNDIGIPLSDIRDLINDKDEYANITNE